MHAKASLTPLGQPVPELPVRDVKRAQHHYRDALGFETGSLADRAENPHTEFGLLSLRNTRAALMLAAIPVTS